MTYQSPKIPIRPAPNKAKELIHIDATHRSSRDFTFRTAEGGKIHGVVAADIELRPNKPAIARMQLLGTFSGSAEPRYMLKDPKTGVLKQVSVVHFEDGSVFIP